MGSPSCSQNSRQSLGDTSSDIVEETCKMIFTDKICEVYTTTSYMQIYERHVVYNIDRVHALIKDYPNVTDMSISGHMYKNLALSHLVLNTLELYNINVSVVLSRIHHLKLLRNRTGTFVTSTNKRIFGNYPSLDFSNEITFVTSWTDPTTWEGTIKFNCIEKVHSQQLITHCDVTTDTIVYSDTEMDADEIILLQPSRVKVVVTSNSDINMKHLANEIYGCKYHLNKDVILRLEDASTEQIQTLFESYKKDNKLYDDVLAQLDRCLTDRRMNHD